MTVQELIIKLSSLDQNLTVVTRGYEDGYDALATVSVEDLVFYPNAPRYSGNYQYEDAAINAAPKCVLTNNR